MIERLTQIGTGGCIWELIQIHLVQRFNGKNVAVWTESASINNPSVKSSQGSWRLISPQIEVYMFSIIVTSITDYKSCLQGATFTFIHNSCSCDL